MAQSIAPHFTRSRVNSAGRRARKLAHSPEDLDVIENWRASHAHVLNAFQTTLRNKNDNSAQIVQRLKRLPTILDKLRRRSGFSLSEMQDVAGCRLIFEDNEKLIEFREKVLSARMSHHRMTTDRRYDYIERPKEDGYRGVHDVYEYNSRRSAGKPWEGLRVELQYRTSVQHAWATAVEVAGYLTENDPKFGRGSPEYIEFFRCASEILARRCEEKFGPYPSKAFSEIESTLIDIAVRTKILDVFDEFNRLENRTVPRLGKNVFMIVKRLDDTASRPEVYDFESFSDALRTVGKFERPEPGGGDYDVVVVRNVSGALIGNAYRNYFSDTREFLRLLREHVPRLSSQLSQGE